MIQTCHGVIATECAGMDPITWADLIVLGAKVAALKSWFAAKKARLGPGADIDTISSAFGADWPVVLGRLDSTTPDAAGRVPNPANASVQEIRVRGLCTSFACIICTRIKAIGQSSLLMLCRHF